MSAHRFLLHVVLSQVSEKVRQEVEETVKQLQVDEEAVKQRVLDEAVRVKLQQQVDEEKLQAASQLQTEELQANLDKLVRENERLERFVRSNLEDIQALKAARNSEADSVHGAALKMGEVEANIQKLGDMQAFLLQNLSSMTPAEPADKGMNIPCSRATLAIFGAFWRVWRGVLARFGGVLAHSGGLWVQGGGSEEAKTRGVRKARASSRRRRPSKRQK